MLTATQSDGILSESMITISFVGTMLILIRFAFDIHPSLPLKARLLFLYGLVVSVIILTIKHLLRNGYLLVEYDPVRIVMGDTLQFIAGILLIYANLNEEPIVSSKRTQLIQTGWISGGLILSISAFVRIVFYSSVLLTIGSGLASTILEYEFLVEAISIIGVLLLALLLFFLAIFLPEGLLLSHYQIYRAAKLYQISEKEKSKSRIIGILDSKEALIDYVSLLPDEVINQDRGS